MSKKVKITEKMRKEIRARIAELSPCRWHIIARSERTDVEDAYLRIDADNKATVFSDDAVTSMIYDLSVRRRILAERAIQWLEDNNLWAGTKFHRIEPSPDEEPDNE